MFKLFLYVVLTQITWAITPIPQGYVAPAPTAPPALGETYATTALMNTTNGVASNDYFGLTVGVSGDGSTVFYGSDSAVSKLYKNTAGTLNNPFSLNVQMRAASINTAGDVIGFVLGTTINTLNFWRRTDAVANTWVLEKSVVFPGDCPNNAPAARTAMDGSGEYFVLACPLNARTHIYKRNAGNWDDIQTLVGVGGMYYGYGLAMSEDGMYVALGSPYDNASKGKIVIYKRAAPTSYTLLAASILGPGQATSAFGKSLAFSFDGKYLIASDADNNTAPFQNTGSNSLGRVFTYKNTADTYTLEYTLNGNGTNGFGSIVKLSASGFNLITGSNNSNSRWYYNRVGIGWSAQDAVYVNTSASTGSNCTASYGEDVLGISRSGDYFATGCRLYNSNTGSAALFKASK